jgi:hypothetical protein
MRVMYFVETLCFCKAHHDIPRHFVIGIVFKAMCGILPHSYLLSA